MNSDKTNSLPMGQPPDRQQIQEEFWKLCEVIARLRAPDGCPWDREQTLSSIKPFTLEETYELLEAIDSNDDAAIVEELGDVLLQVVLDAQIGNDEGRFNITQVVQGLTAKLIRRHPHVFGTDVIDTADGVKQTWDKIKQDEKPNARKSKLDGLPKDLPSLVMAARLQEKAAKVGYDFPHRNMLFSKLAEEMSELEAELFAGQSAPRHEIRIEESHVKDVPLPDEDLRNRAEEELGDVLFVMANIARRWKLNPEEALRKTNAKFKRRFQAIEAGLSRNGISIEEATLIEMEEHYQAEKQREKSGE